MRNQLYPMRLANYIDKNAQHFKEATIAGQNALQQIQEINKVGQTTYLRGCKRGYG